KAEVESDHRGDDIPLAVLPIAIIAILTVFGFPVAIVAVIMFSNWAKSRCLHKTVRMLVEKGQPTPPALVSTPAAASVAAGWGPARFWRAGSPSSIARARPVAPARARRRRAGRRSCPGNVHTRLQTHPKLSWGSEVFDLALSNRLQRVSGARAETQGAGWN